MSEILGHDIDGRPLRVEIVDGPHFGEVITLNYPVPSIRLVEHTYSIDKGCVDVEYKVERVFRDDGSFAGYIGRSGIRPPPSR